jgi:acyl carrier protein
MKKSPILLSILAATQAQAAPKPVYSSHRLTSETVGHSVDISADLSGAKKLFLVVTDGGDGFACDWANWVNPVITGDFGTRKLTEMTPVSTSSDWGNVHMNKNAGGAPMIVNGQPVAEGIGTHAHSVIEFDLPQAARRSLADVPDSARLREDLALDSLALAEAAFKLDEVLGIPVETREVGNLATVGDLHAFFCSRLQSDPS